MSYWKPEFWPVFLGYPEDGTAEILEVVHSVDLLCHLVAWQGNVPWRLRFTPRLRCRYLPSQHAAFVCDWLRRFAATRPETMPCLCAVSETARLFLKSHRETLSQSYLLFDSPDDLLHAMKEAQ